MAADMNPIIITYLILSAIFWTFVFLAALLVDESRQQTSWIEFVVIAVFAACGWLCLYLLS